MYRMGMFVDAIKMQQYAQQNSYVLKLTRKQQLLQKKCTHTFDSFKCRTL